MQTVVITGGTDGLGKGLALHYLHRGARVLAVGSTPAKGEALLAQAATISAAGRAVFLQADLTSVAATRDLVATVESACSSVDKLILCAQRYRLFGSRTVTREGFEHSFALAYLSRYVLGHGLRTALESAPQPVIMNVATPGVPLGRIHWDDPQLARRYSGFKATLQSFRANDLLGVAFAALHADTPIRYVGYNPGMVSTGMPDHLPQPLRTLTKASFTLLATSVPKAVTPMARLLDEPPGERFSAYRTTRRLPLKGPAFDQADALRLHHLTHDLINAV
ncbi:SDR family NAD(P)-dependent oxidoreductase [Streptomyces samsunensis]|uniref:SDR family NAD(P)-dependent oxidoreductase n=1 Tax=Streptomyces TaxID=1883 RepID=UPI000CA3A022|nr:MULTISPECIES: SDR family NAD(P)-dependent oxidoreductase [Streptomyces]MCC4313956.1 SDR family NAD(P)-dependent oxidoreductase [Streptomyces malaysiensis]AUA16399.1 oxidoreductase [Streptomyces sp. M56]MCD9586311.1 SDR family NAD(P)-dependent oxidoreductase [Streptomyces sp. 8ZJF_21]MCM3804433.1 SDR family NAD(P)-dependent oxidoreductase [Streptomyces sp. DR7-3]MCQ6245670.1 SDR family NAD(P)-dependent oxidoreductase [Streptomyces malaysiensis]